ncbi:hypothetical protein [Nostoc favosum]|nr:hypothetical protein [Nostoc favosum]
MLGKCSIISILSFSDRRSLSLFLLAIAEYIRGDRSLSPNI